MSLPGGQGAYYVEIRADHLKPGMVVWEDAHVTTIKEIEPPDELEGEPRMWIEFAGGPRWPLPLERWVHPEEGFLVPKGQAPRSGRLHGGRNDGYRI